MAKILLVDDNIETLSSIKNFLEEKGHQVTALYDPRSAIATLERESFDAVIADKEMQNHADAGLNVAKAARAQGDMPIVVMSGNVSAAQVPAVKKELGEIGGAVSFIDKKTDYQNELLAAIQVSPTAAMSR